MMEAIFGNDGRFGINEINGAAGGLPRGKKGLAGIDLPDVGARARIIDDDITLSGKTEADDGVCRGGRGWGIRTVVLEAGGDGHFAVDPFFEFREAGEAGDISAHPGAGAGIGRVEGPGRGADLVGDQGDVQVQVGPMQMVTPVPKDHGSAGGAIPGLGLRIIKQGTLDNWQGGTPVLWVGGQGAGMNPGIEEGDAEQFQPRFLAVGGATPSDPHLKSPA